MPASAIPGVEMGLGGAGALGSAAGGKSSGKAAQSLAKQQQQLQQQQFGLTKQQVGLGNAALGSSTSYWQDLLKGGQAATQATGPYASLLGQTAQGNRQAIQATTARGGEQNLALAQNYNQLGNNVSRLYAGMQPLAAQSLQQNAATYMGSGSALNPQASPYAASSIYQSMMGQAATGAQGYGSLLYQGLSGKQNSPNQNGGLAGTSGLG